MKLRALHVRRRDVLVGAAALALGCDGKSPTDAADDTAGETAAEPAPERSAEPAAWEAPGTLDEALFAWGVQTGDADTTSVLVSVRTDAPKVQVRVMVAAGEGWAEHASYDLVPEERVARVVVDGLTADTPYALAAYAGEARSRVARVRTPPASSRVVTFGATACLGGNEPWPNLSHAAAEGLDFFVLLGDTIYADNGSDAFQYEAKWDTALSTEGLRAVTASTSLVVTWDDHEVDNNYDEGNKHFEEGLAAFQRALPMRGGAGRASIWRKVPWGPDVDLFVLDCRGERSGKEYLSRAQMDWLKAGLSASTARFKLILNSVPITDYAAFTGEVGVEDRWSGYPEQRTEILAHIEDEGIAGVLWIAGDLHMAQVGHVDPAGGLAEHQWEVLAGCSGSFLNVLANMYEGNEQYPILFGAWNFTRFRCDPALGTIEVTFIGDDASVLAEMTLEL